MTNAELIKVLRWCGSEDERHEMCVDESYRCPMWNEDRITDECKAELMTAAAYALEADEKLIAELLKNIEHWKKLVVKLRAQMPKEGKCDAANVNGDYSDEDKAVMDCSYCPSADGCLEAFSESTLCQNCGGITRERWENIHNALIERCLERKDWAFKCDDFPGEISAVEVQLQ